MDLMKLEPEFCGLPDKRGSFPTGVPRDQAHGVQFLCPRCFLANGGPIGTHWILCWSPSVPEHYEPGPGRWHIDGVGIDDLTLRGVRSDSVLITGGCRAHFYVRNGKIIDC